MEELSVGLVGAVGGAALLAAMAFRHLVETVIKINEALQHSIDERREGDSERQVLEDKVNQLEFQVASLQDRLEEQKKLIEALHLKLAQRKQVIDELQAEIENP